VSIKGIRNWLQNIAESFQPAYDRIRDWHLSPEIDQLLDEVWGKLPEALQGSIFKFIKDIYDKYGAELARVILDRVMKAIKNELE